MIAPELTLWSMLGRMISLAVQPMWVRAPRYSCPAARWWMPSKARIGPQTVPYLIAFCLAGLGIWTLIDFILIILRKVPDSDGRPLS